jgi:hypothetical protein
MVAQYMVAMVAMVTMVTMVPMITHTDMYLRADP